MGDLSKTSRFLAYILHHHPESIELPLDDGGWADTDTLIQCARLEGRSLDRERLEAVIAHNDKARFTLSEDGTRIRTNYGHSIEIDLDLTPRTPPNISVTAPPAVTSNRFGARN